MMNINQINTAGLQKDALNNTHASAVKSSRYTDAQKERIAKASKQFESLLTSMMLKSMNLTLCRKINQIISAAMFLIQYYKLKWLLTFLKNVAWE